MICRFELIYVRIVWCSKLCLFREKPFVAYVICNTDRWTPLSHNSTYGVIPQWRNSRCECQFCPFFWLSGPFFLAGWFWSALNWNRSRCRYRKGLAFHRRSRPRQMISRHRLGLNAISPSSLKVHVGRYFKSTDAEPMRQCAACHAIAASPRRQMLRDRAVSCANPNRLADIGKDRRKAVSPNFFTPTTCSFKQLFCILP